MKKVLGMFALAAVIALPSMSYAATFAYVNASGNVSTVVADTAAQALATAPNMDIHSGVLLLTNPNDSTLNGTSNTMMQSSTSSSTNSSTITSTTTNSGVNSTMSSSITSSSTATR